MATKGTALQAGNASDIARMVSIPQILRHLGWRLRLRNRADCGLCRGHSTGTVAYREHVWHCHRCHQGGDNFKLVMAVNRCGFPDALKYVAELGGVRFQNPKGVDVRREIKACKERQERIENAALGLAAKEYALRLACRNQLDECARVLSTPGPWSEVQWQRAQWACLLRDRYLLPKCTLLAFGAVAERAKYVLADRSARAEMLSAVRDAGGVRADNGRWVEVLA